MRVGFTIIYNGLHHLLHNDWCEKLPKMVDAWIIVEGAAQPNGSTFWCNRLEEDTSWDGTTALVESLARSFSNITYVPHRKGGWESKDSMVNAALTACRIVCNDIYNGNIFLWEFDADEQWTEDQLNEAEKTLLETKSDCGCFHANYFVGENLVAKGHWGEGFNLADPIENAYRRLWKWKGQRFLTHEPPILIGGNKKEVLLPQKFNHYAYYYEKDVTFKTEYYKGYSTLHKRWLSLQAEKKFPQPISRLLDGYWGSTETKIEKLLD